MQTTLYIALAIAMGLIMSVYLPMNSSVAKHLGSAITANVIFFFFALFTAILIFLISGQFTTIHHLKEVPSILYIAGVISAFVVLGIRVSILAVLMNINYKDLAKIAGLAASFGSDFRVNVYQPMYTEEFSPNFEQYWEAFKILFDQSEIISVTEPLVNTFLGLNGLKGTPCGGHSMRITPDGKLKACVYWPESDLTIDDLVDKKEAVVDSPYFKQTHFTPKFCQDCEHVGNCGGGCAARRKLRNRFQEPDEYCPIYQGKTIQLKGRPSSAAKPLRSGSICTTIVRGR